ncbi:hypothetical protein AMTRI_Chr02g259770 [Amborella trichopoda]
MATLLHVPLHAWFLATFGRIAESFGYLIAIRWKSLETLLLGSILLLVEVLDPKCIPPCVWIEVDNLFYPISLAWTEASLPSDNLVASSPHSLPESSSFSWSVASRKSGLAKRRHRQNLHDLFPGKRGYRPSFSASQWSSSQWSYLRIPCDTLPSIPGDDGDDDVRKSARNAFVGPAFLEPISEGGGIGNSYHLPLGSPASLTHRPGKEVVEDLHCAGPSAFFKDPPSLVGVENWAPVTDPIHMGRNSLDIGTPAALTSVPAATRQVPLSPCVQGSLEETATNFSPPSIASTTGGVLSFDTLLSAQETPLSLPLTLGLPTPLPPDGTPNAVFPSILPNLEDPLGSSSEPSFSQCSPSTKSQEQLASFQATPPCRSSLVLSEEAYTIVQSVKSSRPLHPVSPSMLSPTFLPLPFFCHSDPSLFASSLPMEVDPSLLPFGIITVHSLHPSPPNPAHLSELLGPCLPQPSLLIPLSRIMTVLFPYEFSPSLPLNFGPQPFPYHFLSFYTPPPLPFNPCPYPVSNWLLPLSLSVPLPSLQLLLSTLLVLHPLLLLPWLTLIQCLHRFCRLFLVYGNLSFCRLSFFTLFLFDSPPPPLNLQ